MSKTHTLTHIAALGVRVCVCNLCKFYAHTTKKSKRIETRDDNVNDNDNDNEANQQTDNEEQNRAPKTIRKSANMR